LVNDELKAYFRPAFIEIMDASAYNLRKTIPFRINEDVSSLLTTLDDAKDLKDSRASWVCTLVAGFQGPVANDGDSATGDESNRLGETPMDESISAVYVENCRESYRLQFLSEDENKLATARNRYMRFITAVSAHEMGHHPGAQTEDEDHDEMNLMSVGVAGFDTNEFSNARFMPKTVSRFRYCKKWSD